MLVTFKSSGSENITMLGDVALKLIRMMGHSGEIPGAITDKEIPDALQHLEQALSSENTAPPRKEDEDGEASVSMKNRAFPLINMLKASIVHRCSVIWSSR